MVTECSMSDNVAVEYPDVEFVRPCNLCPHMKRITLDGILHSLQTMTIEVIVDPAMSRRARKAPIDRMLAVKLHETMTPHRQHHRNRRRADPGRGHRRPVHGPEAGAHAQHRCWRARGPACPAPAPGRRAASPPRWAKTTAGRAHAADTHGGGRGPVRSGDRRIWWRARPPPASTTWSAMARRSTATPTARWRWAARPRIPRPASCM